MFLTAVPPNRWLPLGFPRTTNQGWAGCRHKDAFACVDLECQQSAESRFSVGTPAGNYNHQFAEGQHQPMSALVF